MRALQAEEHRSSKEHGSTCPPQGTGGDRRRWHRHTEGLGSQAQESALNLETAGSAYGWEVSRSHLSFNPERSLTPPAGGPSLRARPLGPEGRDLHWDCLDFIPTA